MGWSAQVAIPIAALLSIANAAPDEIKLATGAALQADMHRALSHVQRVVPSDQAERAFVDCMITRFGPTNADPPIASGDAIVLQIVAAYRVYWRDAMMRPTARDEAEVRLLTDLGRLIGTPFASFSEAEPVLEERLRQVGYMSLQGRTGLLRELMIWRTQSEEVRDVELPEGRHRVRVILLDNFDSLGWGDFATCGRRGAGGWASKSALFAVVPRYTSLDNEEFRVTFLGHETQHFADLERFPDLLPWELEYRAKLVELSQANVTRNRVLQKFIEDQGDDPASAHSYANRRVLRAMMDRLSLSETAQLAAFDLGMLQTAARQALQEDTAQRE